MTDEQTVDDILGNLVRLGACPMCEAEYPDFHSPVGSLGTLCDACGWSSQEANPYFRSDPLAEPCCDLHGIHCEPPSELCCEECGEARHPDHEHGESCVLDEQAGDLNG